MYVAQGPDLAGSCRLFDPLPPPEIFASVSCSSPRLQLTILSSLFRQLCQIQVARTSKKIFQPEVADETRTPIPLSLGLLCGTPFLPPRKPRKLRRPRVSTGGFSFLFFTRSRRRFRHPAAVKLQKINTPRLPALFAFSPSRPPSFVSTFVSPLLPHPRLSRSYSAFCPCDQNFPIGRFFLKSLIPLSSRGPFCPHHFLEAPSL